MSGDPIPSDYLAALHTQAVLDLLADADRLTVYDKAPRGAGNAKFPHTIPYPDPGLSSSDRLSNSRTDFTQVIQFTCVGQDTYEAQVACDLVRNAIDGVRPDIAGRSCWPIEQLLARPIVDDQDNPAGPVCFGVVQYRIHSTPA